MNVIELNKILSHVGGDMEVIIWNDSEQRLEGLKTVKLTVENSQCKVRLDAYD